MTKEDYMQLSKERLAELLAERDAKDALLGGLQFPIQVGQYTPPCYYPGGICTNPFHDCINCPRQGSTGGFTTVGTNTAGAPDQQ